MSRCRSGALMLLLALAACDGSVMAGGDDDGDGDGVCVDDGNAAPKPPAVVSPGPGARDVVPASLTFRADAYVDPDGDPAGGADWEIWTAVGPTLVTRVWHAELADAAAPVRLGDGRFEAGFAALGDWSAYVVRVRYRDADAVCPRVSDWSPVVAFATDDGSAAFFDEWTVRDVQLELSAESMAAMDAEATPPDCVPFQRSYRRGNVIVDGVRFDGVGVKLKGGCGSARPLAGKASFKVNLDWDDPDLPGCPTKRRLAGQKHLTLNAQVQDRSASHERLGYRFYAAAGVPAPRAAPARVYVNGELFGLYLNVETVDRRFLAHRYGNEDGMLYEGTYWCDLVPGNVPPGDEDTYCLAREFSPDVCDSPDAGADPQDYGPLRAMVAALDAIPDGGWMASIGGVFALNEILDLWAADAVMGHWDGYAFEIMNNYRVYHEPGVDRWTVIPTGIDQTFGDDVNPWNVHHVLARRCVAEPACEALFAARLAAMREIFAGLDLETHRAKIREQIRADVVADPRREYDLATFDAAQESTRAFIAGRPARIGEHLAAHGY